MRDLFKAELIRFRAWAIGYALVQLVLVGFLTRVVDLAQQPQLVYQAFGGVYALSGLLLGMVQMGTYRRPGTWLNLLHRPLPRWRIAAALLGAGAVLVMTAIVPPLLAIAGWQHGMTARVVDVRHLLLVLSGGEIGLCGYLAGCHVMLVDRRYGFCALVFLVLLFFAQATGLGATVLQLLVIAWLAMMVVGAFKPDLASPPRGMRSTLLIAAPLLMSLWLALKLIGLGVEFAWIAQGSHPLNSANPPRGGAVEADRAEGRDLLIAGLRDSRARDAALWREQAAVSEVFNIGAPPARLSARNELTNRVPMEFDDDERHVRWVFSHDCLCFRGIGLLDGRAAGELHVAGGAAFPSPPVPIGDGNLLGREAFYQYDGESRTVLPRARVPRGEVLLRADTFGDRFALLSDRALSLYDKRELDAGDAMLVPTRRIPLPGRVGELERIDVMELLDGELVSFTFTRGAHNADGAPYQQIVHADARGRVVGVARRDLDGDYPTAWRYRDWYASPLLDGVHKAATGLFADYTPERDIDPPPVPPSVLAIAGALMAMSLLLATWRTRRIDLSRNARIAWCAACGLFGLPALIGLWLLYPARAVEDAVPLAHASPA